MARIDVSSIPGHQPRVTKKKSDFSRELLEKLTWEVHQKKKTKKKQDSKPSVNRKCLVSNIIYYLSLVPQDTLNKEIEIIKVLKEQPKRFFLKFFGRFL